MTHKVQRIGDNLESCASTKRITIIITGLATGGAEMMLLKLCSTIDKSRFSLSVVSLRDHGSIGPKIEDLGIPVYAIGLHRKISLFTSFFKLRKLLADLRPDLIQGWMYHGNLAAFLFMGKAPVCWSIRQSFYGLDKQRRLTSLVIVVGRYLSKFSNCIIYNSKTSARQHKELGFMEKRALVIPNGFNIDILRPDRNSRLLLRKEWGLNENVVLIGLIARFHPMKDHEGFLKAAALLLRETPNVYFLLVGSGVDTGNAELCGLIDDLGIGNQFLLLGERTDIPKVTAALDIATSCSAWGEGFANSVGEAMSCGVPCVVTDVGDSAWIVGETGRVVPPGDPNALAAAWKSLIDLGSDELNALGALARERVRNNFSLDSVVAQYESLYLKMIEKVKV